PPPPRHPPAGRPDHPPPGRRVTAAPSPAWPEPAAGLFPAGVNSPVRASQAVGGAPPLLVRGNGAFVWDEAGRRYIDYVGAFGPLLLGHGAVAEAIATAAALGGPFGVTSPGEVRLAEMIRMR